MGKTASSWFGGNVERLLLSLLVLHAVAECATAVTSAPNHGDSKRKAQSTIQSNNNVLAVSMEQAGDQGKDSQDNKNHTDNEKQKDTKNQTTESEKNKAPNSTQSAPEIKKNGGNNATANGSPSKDSKTTDLKDNKLNIVCNKSTDCADYNDTACVRDPADNKTRCLCGDRSQPRTMTFCKNIRRYIRFPCTKNNQCIENAECVLGNSTFTKPEDIDLLETHTASICWCMRGYFPGKNSSKCLDPLGKLQMDQDGKISNLQRELHTLQDKQAKAEERLKKLESTGTDIFPSITVTVLMAASMLAMH